MKSTVYCKLCIYKNFRVNFLFSFRIKQTDRLILYEIIVIVVENKLFTQDVTLRTIRLKRCRGYVIKVNIKMSLAKKLRNIGMYIYLGTRFSNVKRCRFDSESMIHSTSLTKFSCPWWPCTVFILRIILRVLLIRV